MSAQLKALYEFQTVELELAKAQKAKSTLDDGSAKRREVEAARDFAERADKLWHQTTADLQDKELNLKSVETKRKTFRDKLYSGAVTNPKELESMEKEIEVLGRQKDKLENEILELMDLAEERRAAAQAAKAELDRLEQELFAYLEKLKEQDAILTSRIKDLTLERERLLPSVDPVLLRRYESLKPRFGGVVVARIDGGQCSACHTQIMPGLLREIKSNPGIQTCENCGRILYLDESS